MDPLKWINQYGPIADFFNKFLAANDTDVDQKEEKISFFSSFKPLGCIAIITLLVGLLTYCSAQEADAKVTHINYLLSKN